jgi:hypothetical protein
MLICGLPNGPVLKAVYLIWNGFLGLFFIEMGLMIVVVLCGLYGY